MVETLVGMAILAAIGVAFLASLTLSSKMLLKTEIEEEARNLASMTIEQILNSEFNQNYSSFNDNETYKPFIITVNPPEYPESSYADKLQLITVNVTHGTTGITLQAYKVKHE